VLTYFALAPQLHTVSITERDRMRKTEIKRESKRKRARECESMRERMEKENKKSYMK
jgi:hypothetical protein